MTLCQIVFLQWYNIGSDCLFTMVCHCVRLSFYNGMPLCQIVFLQRYDIVSDCQGLSITATFIVCSNDKQNETIDLFSIFEDY